MENTRQAGLEPIGEPSVKSGVKTASATVFQTLTEASVKSLVKPAVEPIVEGLTVRSLQQLKLELEGEEEARKRVLKGVGQQAYSEFRTLVTNLSASGKQVILDPNVRTLYYTIVNFGRVAVSPAMRRWEPLSNFCLRVAPFLDLEAVLTKDAAILATVVRQLGGQEVAAFRARVDQLRRAGGEFVLQDQDENIVLYHKVCMLFKHMVLMMLMMVLMLITEMLNPQFRNYIIDCLMARLGLVHSRVQAVSSDSSPPAFNIAVAMLNSLMATQYNGQVN